MSTNSIRTTVRKVLSLISDGQYGCALQMCSISRLTEQDLRGVIRDYGFSFAQPSEDTDQYLDIVAVDGSAIPTWSVRASLWTLEEGRSDLTLELTVSDGPAGVAIELDDLRVM
jgi:hypothetical protein